MENQSKQQLANNSWQNQGICRNFAKSKIKRTYRETWLCIVDESFAYGKIKTNRHDLQWWAKATELNIRTLIRHLKWLEDNEFIKKIPHKGYIKEGGSLPYAYSPVFPKGYGKIFIGKEVKQKHKELKLKKSLGSKTWE
jgi:hypothetical protein